jgi:HD-GYP domain-containing protein (c-di-GMP phosphodiesterase class II)
MPDESSAIRAPADLAAFVPFDLRSFAPNRAPMLDLYYRVGGNYVLLCNARSVMTRAAKLRLLEGGVRVVYARIVGGRISAGGPDLPELLALPDDHMPISIKAGLLYHSAVSATRSVLSSADSTNNDIAAVCEFVGVVALQLSRDPETLQALLALMRHDSFVYVHSVNVASYSTILAILMGVPREDVTKLSRAAFLHDVGKTRVPLDILNKRGELTTADWKLIQQHPEWSVAMLNDEILKRPLAKDIILQHHERLDGKGYPHGLSATDIHPLSRVVSLVDVFDALTSERPYRASMSPFDALRVVRDDELTGHLDRDVFVSLVRMLGAPYQRELERR